MTAYFRAVWTPLQVAVCSLARSDHQSAAWLWFVPCWYMAQAACLSEPSVLHIRLNWTGRGCLQLRQWQNNPDWPVEWNGRDSQAMTHWTGWPTRPILACTATVWNGKWHPRQISKAACFYDSLQKWQLNIGALQVQPLHRRLQTLPDISALWNEVARTLRPRDSMPDRLAWFSCEHSEGSKTASRCQPKSNPLNLNLTHRTDTIHYYSI